MATVRPSALLADIRGSLGDVTFQAHRGQLVAKSRARVTNRQSPRQLTQRALGAQRANTWLSLSEQDRTAWTAASKIIPGPRDKFGIPKQLTPFAFFLYQSMYLTAANFPPSTTPTSLTIDTRLTAFAVDLALAGPWTVTHESPVGTSSWVGPIFCSRPFRNSEPSRWPAERMVGNQRWTDSGTPDLLPGFEAAFGAPIEGEFLRFRTLPIMSLGLFKGPSIYFVGQVYT